MNTVMINIVMLIQVLSALVIIGLVLLQHGKGADMGAAFGSGASGSLFGATGSSNFLSKSTGIAAAIFFAATLALAYLSSSRHATVNGGVLDALPPVSAPASASSASAKVIAPVPASATNSAAGSTAAASVVVSPASSAPAASAQQPAKVTPVASSPANQIPK